MPNKTIYIKDADAEIWDKAQKRLGGESISSIITDCLRERLKAGKTLDNVEAMKDVLAEVNLDEGLAVELHPFWSPVILDANTLDVGYKLHQKRAKPDRIMSLIVDLSNFEADGSFSEAATVRIKASIMEFWDGRRTDQHAVVRISPFDIQLRLQSLVGRKGLLKIAQYGEVEFTFRAVHPAPNLPAYGDDDALQHAITQSDFTIQFAPGTLIDGSNHKVISGRYISLIRGRY
jgi:hypothetical protein